MRYKLHDRWILTDEKKKKISEIKDRIFDFFINVIPITGGILVLIFLSWVIYKCFTAEDPEPQYSYYKVEYDCFIAGRTDTIHKVLYTKYGKVHLEEFSDGEVWFKGAVDDHKVKEEYCPVHITRQTPITKEEYDSF